MGHEPIKTGTCTHFLKYFETPGIFLLHYSKGLGKLSHRETWDLGPVFVPVIYTSVFELYMGLLIPATEKEQHELKPPTHAVLHFVTKHVHLGLLLQP